MKVYLSHYFSVQFHVLSKLRDKNHNFMAVWDSRITRPVFQVPLHWTPASVICYGLRPRSPG